MWSLHSILLRSISPTFEKYVCTTCLLLGLLDYTIFGSSIIMLSSQSIAVIMDTVICVTIIMHNIIDIHPCISSEEAYIHLLI